MTRCSSPRRVIQGHAPCLPHLHAVGARPAEGTRTGRKPTRRRNACVSPAALTPHHALLDAGCMEEPTGILLKVNPPLRPQPMPGHHAAAADRRRDRLDRDRSRAAHARRQDRGPRLRHPGAPLPPAVPRDARGAGDAGGEDQRAQPRCGLPHLRHDFGGKRPPAELDLAREYPFDPFAVLTRSGT